MNDFFSNVLIVGAGVIGSALALSLARCGITVVIIDCQDFFLVQDNHVPNIRVSAINYASTQFFKKIDIWKNISKKFITSYFCMKTWECPSAMVTFNANSIGIKKMGCVIENNRLKSALWQNILDSKLIIFYFSSKLISLEYDGMNWKCTLNKNIVINSQLLVGADGIYSNIRNKMKVKMITWKHHQCCMLLTIKTEKNTRGTIWQVFTPRGPIGFLPLHDNWGSLMWFDTPENINRLKNLPKSILERKIEHNFRIELGKVSLYNVHVIPVINQRALQYIGEKSVLIGDAAHSIHPLAGQGINLGIRDVIVLTDLLTRSNIFTPDSFKLNKALLSYQNNRQYDILIMQSSINWLYSVFHNNILPIKIARNLAFLAIEKFPYAKKRLLRYAALGL